jgi:hypothetical protein
MKKNASQPAKLTEPTIKAARRHGFSLRRTRKEKAVVSNKNALAM